jgi:hypothetical protein
MRKLSMKQKALVAGVGVAVLSTSGVAFAYWTTGGTGSGTASTSAGAANKLGIGGDVPLAMYPGDSAQTITATVTNNGSENYKVQSLKAYLTVADPQGTAGCSSSDYLINNVAAPGTAAAAADLSITPIDLAPAGTQTVDYTIHFNNKSTNQDFCKGASVTVHYVAT